MLSVAESSEILNVSPARVRQLIADGSLDATKVGRAWMLPEATVYNRLSEGVAPGRPAVVKTSKADVDRDDAECFSDDALRSLYEQCKAAFSRFPSIATVAAAESQEEADFYMATFDFFLRERQRELVKRGVF